eukprot:15290658-Ditylum_brightwellii.AAC.1
MRSCTKTEDDSSSGSSGSSSVQVIDVSHPFYLSLSKCQELDEMLSKKGPLYTNLFSSSDFTSKLIRKEDIYCRKQPAWLIGGEINIAIKKLKM